MAQYLQCSKVDQRRAVEVCRKKECKHLVVNEMDGLVSCLFESAEEKRIRKGNKIIAKKNEEEGKT